MFKNWKTICAEQNQGLRSLIATSDDERILKGLQKGFPELFTQEEQQIRIPLSSMKAWRPEGEADVPLCEDAIAHFGIPSFTFGDVVGKSFPAEWRTALKGKNIWLNSDSDSTHLHTQPEYVLWQGKRFLVADYTDDGEMLIIVPEECIDVNS